MQKVLQIDGTTAQQLYPGADKKLKSLLENEFGKDFLVPPPITDRVKTFEDACKIVGVKPDEVINAADNPDEAAYKKIKVIALALNEGWKPDWTDGDEYKYYPWFDLSSGSGLRYCDFGTRHSISAVGSRLCFKSRELAEYAGTQFIDLYTDFFIK